MYERELLSRLRHSLIINLQYAFQDYNNLYLVLDLLTGGDLRYQIGHHQRQYFSEIQTKFFVSCIIGSLIYIHSKNIIHRDIKPENLVFDDKGYLHITDFGIAKFKSKNNKNETSGTPGYMAPEVMKGMNHTGSVDYFAVGVITYELMMGQRPYLGKSRKEIKEQMMSRQIYIDEEMLPLGWSLESADFVNKLMVRKDSKRLGYYNDLDIKNHPWFYDIDFNELVEKKIDSPFLPRINHDNYDKKYCEEIEKIGYETNYRYEEYKANEHYQDIFYGFTFYNVDEAQLQIYKKPNVKYSQNIQNQKFKIIDNIKDKDFKTINVNNYDKNNKDKKNIVVIRKKKTIDFENKLKNNDTIDVDEYIDYHQNKSYKSINIFYDTYKNEKNKKNFVTNIHKRIKSNLIGHNYLHFLQKKKLLNLDSKTLNISNNESTSINNTKSKKRISHSINYHKKSFNKINKKEKIIHNHANSFSNNLYINLLNKIKDEKNLYINEEYSTIDNKINKEKRNQKRTIELNQIPRLIKMYNNYKSSKNVKNKNDILSSIDKTDSISSGNNNDLNQKVDMMKASSNFYIRQKIPHNKLTKITPINLRNKNILSKTNYKFTNNYDSIRNNDTIVNSRRSHIKVRTKSFSGKSFLDNSKDMINNVKIMPFEIPSIDKKDSFINNNNTEKKIFLDLNKKMNRLGEIRHNYSYSSFNNKNKIESLIKNLIEPDKSKKKTIPINYRKSSNTLITPKVSTLHKKIPMPSSLGQKIFHKRMNGFMSNKNKSITNNSFSTSLISNSINNSSMSKNYNGNHNTSINKNLKKEEFNKNINLNNNSNNKMNPNKKKNIKSILDKNPNFNMILKKLNDFSKKNPSTGINLSYLINKSNNIIDVPNKENKTRKFAVKNNLFKNQIKKIGEKKSQIRKNEGLKNIKQNEIKDDYGNILSNNILVNKKFSNYNHKNKYNKESKIFKSSIGNFSHPSYSSTTSSGGKINNK